jgi:MYXO-CTERM domain-containing protein
MIRHASFIVAAILIQAARSIASPIAVAPKLDPKVARALETGLMGAWHHGPVIPGRAKVLIELREPFSETTLAELRSAGAELTIVGAKTLAYKRFVPAMVSTANIAAVTALSSVARISLAVSSGPLPLDQSAKLMRLADARGARPALDLLTGKGVLIGDSDSMVDPFHPTFFKGDAGYFDWIDVNQDGRFNSGTDAIDINKNGTADPGETVQMLPAATVNYLGPLAARGGDFDPSIDWVYLDVNGNGQRDFGQAAGFDDEAPALGEPLFVPDDVDRNGRLDVGERLVRLGSSKFKKIYVHLESFGPNRLSVDQVYERGVNLAATQVNYSSGAFFGYPDAYHATGVNTILVGDVPLVGRRWVGIAPEADVLVSFDPSGRVPMDGVTWALGEGPNVMLYEIAPWTGYPLDGSDPLSTMIDMATIEDHVTNTCPTGDQGSARKHAHADVAAGATASLAFDIPHLGPTGLPIRFVQISLNLIGSAPQSVVLKEPQGTSGNLLSNRQGQLPSGTRYALVQEDTPRGTHFVDLLLSTNSQALPTNGACTLEVKVGTEQGSTAVDAYLADNQSVWALGAAWDPSIATDRSTIGVPSVADHCIAVNAAPDHLSTPDEPWFAVDYSIYDVPADYTDAQTQIRAYTPRGPRIDGVIKPDITAPDNPWVAMVHDGQFRTPYGSFFVFSGTSGASPHVTGVAALLAQAGIYGDAARDAIRAGAATDAVTGPVPNGDYGFGRLDAAGAFGIKDTGTDPTVSVTVQPASPTTADEITFILSGQGEGLEMKWDDGYDGTWDTPYAAIGPRTLSAELAPGTYPFKVRVRNRAGHVAEAVTWVTVEQSTSGCGCRIGGAGGAQRGGTLLVVAGLLLVLSRRIVRKRFGAK